jgi:hypothetical protein
MAAEKAEYSDQKMGEALLQLDLAPAARPAVGQVERIIESDRRRVRWLTRLTIALWIMAALGAVLIFVGGGLVFPMIAKLLKQAGEGSLDRPDTPFLMLAKLTAMTMVVGCLSFVTLVAAGLATVLLVFRSRRATLRQINANLLQISEQLKQLRLGAGPMSGVEAGA